MRSPDHPPAAVIAHGSGSTAEFVTRVFTRPLAEAGYRLVTWDRRGPAADGAAQLAALAGAERATLVGGVSLGAMLAVQYALSSRRQPLHGLLLALPPWLGPPGAVAALSDGAADRIDQHGLDAALDEIEESAVPWVAAEIRRAWPTYGAGALIAELRSTARTVGPAVDDLARCTTPVGLVAMDDDPFHPADVATQWAAALPHAVVETIPLDGPATNVDVIGAAAVAAWQRARRVSESR
jgi:pimeloyl-ACP methyl ester carboxylesterase